MCFHSVCFVTVCTVICSCNYGVILQFCSVPPVSFFVMYHLVLYFPHLEYVLNYRWLCIFFFQSQFTAVDFRSLDCFSCNEISFTVLLKGSIG